MKIIGLTGGIGSGKTTVAGILEKHFSLKVIYTDDIAREQMSKGGVSYQKVVDEFGQDILMPDGEIDKDKLSDIIFNDENKKKKLNGLTHPPVKVYIFDTIRELEELGTFKILFIETALLIEAGYSEFCDEVWYVYAPEDERRDRLKRFRNMDDDKIDSIFAKQCTDEEYRICADRVLNNENAITVYEMFEQLLSFIEE